MSAYLFETKKTDSLAVSLPLVAALASVGAGIAALTDWNICAALLGIIGGLTASGGILAAYRSSKMRDDEMRFWVNAIAHANEHIPTGFGS